MAPVAACGAVGCWLVISVLYLGEALRARVLPHDGVHLGHAPARPAAVLAARGPVPAGARGLALAHAQRWPLQPNDDDPSHGGGGFA